MTPLKPEQRKYAQQRINQIYNEKVEELRKKHTKTVKGLDHWGKVDLIKDGYADLRSRWSLTPGIKLIDAFTYAKDADVHDELNEKAYNKDFKVLAAKKNKVVDQIMLGDSEKALKLIEEFLNA